MKYLVFIAAMLVGSSCVFAANIRDLDVGDGVYLQGIFSDELVYVVRIDYENNRVKIRRTEDGTTKWVNASDLISRESSTGNDVVRGAVAIGIIACALDPESCKSTNKNSAPPSDSSTTESRYVVCIKNKLGGMSYYSYRWENEIDWKSTSLNSGWNQWHSSPINQKFYIRFDESLSDDYKEKEYYLEAYKTAERCDGAKTYEMYSTEQKFDLRLVN